MKTYILDSFNRFKRYSEKLDAKTVLCNKCWWVFNDAGEKESYIFKEDGTIIITRLGAVTYGKWEYLPVNKSIIISGNNQSYMVLPSFVDEYILALQVDGTNNFAFLIDEQNKSKFAPKSYQEVIGYFEEKERIAIETERVEKAERERQRLIELQEAEKREAERERQRLIELQEAEKRVIEEKNKYIILSISGLLCVAGIGFSSLALLINDGSIPTSSPLCVPVAIAGAIGIIAFFVFIVAYNS